MATPTQELAFAMQSWYKLPKVLRTASGGLETNSCPMHPTLYVQLSRVSGFKEANGSTYQEYIETWKQRDNQSELSGDKGKQA